jgi:membrane-associated progesterone receptor component
MTDNAPEHTSPKNFEPKHAVEIAPPKDDPISTEDLSKCDGTDSSKPTYVAIKGTVFDVSGNAAYGVKGQYHGKHTG